MNSQSPIDSQAQSAGSIPVTRSICKPQVRAPGLVRCPALSGVGMPSACPMAPKRPGRTGPDTPPASRERAPISDRATHSSWPAPQAWLVRANSLARRGSCPPGRTRRPRHHRPAGQGRCATGSGFTPEGSTALRHGDVASHAGRAVCSAIPASPKATAALTPCGATLVGLKFAQSSGPAISISSGSRLAAGRMLLRRSLPGHRSAGRRQGPGATQRRQAGTGRAGASVRCR